MLTAEDEDQLPSSLPGWGSGGGNGSWPQEGAGELWGGGEWALPGAPQEVGPTGLLQPSWEMPLEIVGRDCEIPELQWFLSSALHCVI